MIEALGIALHVVGTERAQRVGIAQDVTPQGMTGEEQALELVVDKFRGLVLIALNLVDDHLHLALHLFLGIGALQGNVEQEVDGA